MSQMSVIFIFVSVKSCRLQCRATAPHRGAVRQVTLREGPLGCVYLHLLHRAAECKPSATRILGVQLLEAAIHLGLRDCQGEKRVFCNVLHGSIERRNTEERRTSCIIIRAIGNTDGVGERKSLQMNGCGGECTPCRFVNKPSSRISLLKKRRLRFDRRMRRICRCSSLNGFDSEIVGWRNVRGTTKKKSMSQIS